MRVEIPESNDNGSTVFFLTRRQQFADRKTGACIHGLHFELNIALRETRYLLRPARSRLPQKFTFHLQ